MKGLLKTRKNRVDGKGYLEHYKMYQMRSDCQIISLIG